MKIFDYIFKRIIYLLTGVIYLFALLFYDKKYLNGKNFDRYHFSIGWKWILRYFFPQKILRNNSHVPFPVPSTVMIANPQNIFFDNDDMRIFHTCGSYFQGINGKIIFGKNIMVAPGAGFINANHNIYDILSHNEGKDIVIGNNCWIGMNAVILPGVHLGDYTIVGAGTIVTKSFTDGHCVIAGNPAKLIKRV